MRDGIVYLLGLVEQGIATPEEIVTLKVNIQKRVDLGKMDPLLKDVLINYIEELSDEKDL